MLCLKIAGWVTNSVDPDETPHSAASYLGLNCLLRPDCPNTYGKYGMLQATEIDAVNPLMKSAKPKGTKSDHLVCQHRSIRVSAPF